MQKRTELVCVLIFILFFGPVRNSFSYENQIIVDFHKERPLPRLLFGNNLIAYDPNSYENWERDYFGYADYGAGVWDPKKRMAVPEVTDLMKAAGISVLRFPGGCGVHHYDWKKSIGHNRKHFLFGLDEFLSICKTIGAIPVITLSYFNGSEQDMADLVEYLNAPSDSLHPWAINRAKNGHIEPYDVTYFEFGNEDWHGDHKNKKSISPTDYAQKYLRYYHAMKTIDSTIKLGAILHAPEWDALVLPLIQDKVDFTIKHQYPSSGGGGYNVRAVYLGVLASALARQNEVCGNMRKSFYNSRTSGLPLAITEYNGEYPNDNNILYRHALGNALLVAEVLRIYMSSTSAVTIANYWQFCNSHWGMIANGFDGTSRTLHNSYYKRPNYYVFEMYHKHFGDVLIDVDIKCNSYDVSEYLLLKTLLKRIKTGTLIRNNLAVGAWEIAPAGGVSTLDSNGVLELAFAGETYNYYHSTKSVPVEPGAFYKVSGYIKTDGLDDDNGVCLEVQDARGWTQTHSAESTERVKGTTDWQYVEAIYQTLPDAREVKVIARRIGEKGPLQGKAYFKDVRLEKFIPSIDTKIPYLSVNASKSADGSKVFLMVINKNMDKSEAATIELKDFIPAAEGNAWVLNGPSVDATNEKKHDNVKVTHKPFKVAGSSFEYTFEPHSLTAIELTRQN